MDIDRFFYESNSSTGYGDDQRERVDTSVLETNSHRLLVGTQNR